MRALSSLLGLIALGLLLSCATPTVSDAPPRLQGERVIYVVRHALHTGVVVAASAASSWPAARELADAEFFEVGWGDRRFYMAADPGIWLGLRALLWPTDSALHVVAFNGPVARTFPEAEIIALPLSADGLARLAARVRDSHALDAAGQPIVLGPGETGRSRFYASRERFHLLQTCNVWVARLLQHAGIAVDPAQALTAGALLAQLRPIGVVVQHGR